MGLLVWHSSLLLLGAPTRSQTICNKWCPQMWVGISTKLYFKCFLYHLGALERKYVRWPTWLLKDPQKKKVCASVSPQIFGTEPNLASICLTWTTLEVLSRVGAERCCRYLVSLINLPLACGVRYSLDLSVHLCSLFRGLNKNQAQLHTRTHTSLPAPLSG